MATQVVDLTKLPFIKSLLASMTPGPDISQEFQHSGPNAALGDTVDMSQQPQSRIPKYLLPSEMGPPAPPPDMQQQDALPAPDLSVGQPPPVPQQHANPVQDLTQSMVQDQTAPNLRTAMYTANAGAAPTPTKANRLLQILRGGLTGGAAGAGQRTFGAGFQQAQTLPLEVQKMGLQNEQIRQLLPFLRAQNIAGLQKTASEAQKNVAEAGKAQAEVEGMPIRQALERAQTEAAYYKDDPNLGLIDVRTGQPVNPSGMAPLSPEEAQILGKHPGERVPLKLKNTANEIVVRGLTNVTTGEGVFERNRQTGSMTRLGSAPMLAIANTNQLPTGDATDMAANYYASTGTLPSGFGRSPATSAAIIKRAAELHPGEDIAKNKLDYEATKRYMGTINGTQQVRLRQAISTAADSLDKIQSLYNEWQQLAPTSGFKTLNHAALVAMKNVPGRAGAVATALDAQIADLTSELGNVYMGGNSPTDHALSLAQKNLSADWNRETFEEALKQSRLNLGIRKNSIFNSSPAGVSNNNLFTPPNTPAQQEPTATGANGHKIAFRNGAWVDATTNQPIQ